VVVKDEKDTNMDVGIKFTSFYVLNCTRDVDSNSRSLMPMTRYVTRCSQQVGKN
jgi:hypothetical protein